MSAAEQGVLTGEIPDEMPVPSPFPADPFVWVLTVDRTTTQRCMAALRDRMLDGLPDEVRERARIVVLTEGCTLQALADDDLERVGLQRIEAR